MSAPADPRVAAAALAGYDAAAVRAAVLDAAGRLGWGAAGAGAFGAVVPAGARVLVKPNWVLHVNRGPGGFEPLVTHGAVVRGVVEALLEGAPASVLVGDAPVQGCDFGRLLDASALPAWAADLAGRDPRFAGLRDFRRTVSVEGADGVREVEHDRQSLDRFVLFDLGTESLLEPITGEGGSFRVTQYPPELMGRTHAPGRHQYLVARDVMEADVVVNLPKLKTHKKAGVTCALKNLIGINGNKEFLPHHRVGGAGEGGDCYPGRSVVKRTLERAWDFQNAADSRWAQRAGAVATRVLDAAARRTSDRLGVEGSWSGNDTIWRTCLDLNRILLYGRADGTLADEPQRRVLHLVDAVVAGHGDGPLSPQPLPLGLLLAGASGAAVDWVGARLLGYDPRRIPIASHAFDRFRWPITTFGAGDVRLVGALGEGAAGEVLAGWAPPPGTQHPEGWVDATEGTR